MSRVLKIHKYSTPSYEYTVSNLDESVVPLSGYSVGMVIHQNGAALAYILPESLNGIPVDWLNTGSATVYQDNYYCQNNDGVFKITLPYGLGELDAGDYGFTTFIFCHNMTITYSMIVLETGAISILDAYLPTFPGGDL